MSSLGGGISSYIGRKAAIVIAAVALAAGAVIAPVVTGGGTDPCAGFDFCDEFSGSSLDTSKWIAVNSHADLSNNEPGCYTSDNVSVGSGVLTETIRRDTSFVCPDSTGESDYPSGAVQWKTQTFTNGTIEVRAKVAGCFGCWPAIWLLGTDCQSPQWLTNGDDPGTCNWPATGSGEIDIADWLHCDYEGAYQNIFSPSGNNLHQVPIGTGSNSADKAFHIYTLIRTGSSLTFKIDGTTTTTFSSGLPSGPMFLIMNTSIGGNGGNCTINNATLPATTQIDYVHVTAA